MIGRSSRLNEALDGRATTATRLPFAIVHVEASTGELRVPSAGRAPDHCPDGGQQPARCCEVQRRRQCARVDLRTPERFGRIDVAESRDDALVEKSNLDRNASTSQRGAQRGGCEPRVEWLGTEVEWKIDSRRMDVDRGESARVIEDDTDVRLKTEDGSREARHRLRHRSDDPISVHSEVHVKDTPIFEMNELMLPATFDRAYARTGERAKSTASQSSSQGGVQHACAPQRLPFDRRTKEARRAFDFGKLRHERSR